MPSGRAIFLAAAVLAALALGAPARAQDPKQDDPRRANDPIVIPPGQTELIYHRVDDIPRQLRTALKDCNYEVWLSDNPIRIIRPEPGRGPLIALAPCGHIVNLGAAFTIGRWWQPEPIDFIVMAAPGGFTTERHPGYLDWNADTRALTATMVTDVCQGGETRHSYRYNRTDLPFILLKVERRALACDGPAGPWIVAWEAQDWPRAK